MMSASRDAMFMIASVNFSGTDDCAQFIVALDATGAVGVSLRESTHSNIQGCRCKRRSEFDGAMRLCVFVKATTGLTAEPTSGDVFSEQWAGTIFRIAEAGE